uniref:Reverse transcriptase domain-containing protein n=1 Tax=Fagus sylvatica TaxID=28930 RepID=A0A2N9EFD4_FAGSY
MPFGLKNAGATYQRLMNKMFHNQIRRNVEVYIDDMLVKTKDEDKHLDDLEETFRTLRQYRMKLNPSKCVFGVCSGKFLGFMVSQRGIEANPDKIKVILEMTRPRTVKEVPSLTGRVAALNRFVSWAIDNPSKQGEHLSLYLAVSLTAVSSALIKEENGVQLPVYYTSKAFQGAEERYHAMEKLALALVGVGGVEIVFKTPEGRVLKHAVRLQYPTTNNEAEYEALLIGLRITKVLGVTTLKVQLVVGQVNGEYEAKKERMVKYLDLVKGIMTDFNEVIIIQIPREQNIEADTLAELASSKEPTDQRINVQYSPSHKREEMNPIDISDSWMTSIAKYLEDGTLPTNVVEVRKLKVRATRFILVQGILYRRGFSLPYLRCLDKLEAEYVMKEVHEGICGNHSGARSLVHKLV